MFYGEKGKVLKGGKFLKLEYLFHSPVDFSILDHVSSSRFFCWLFFIFINYQIGLSQYIYKLLLFFLNLFPFVGIVSCN